MSIIAELRNRAWLIRNDLRRMLYLRRVTRGNQKFDTVLGTETAKKKSFEEYKISQNNPEFFTKYEPISESSLRAIIEYTLPNPGEYTFVDIGSGKGKALLLAATYPFKRVTGVEFDEPLHLVADVNIDIALKKIRARCTDVRSLHMDAIEFTDYSQKTLVLFFNSFQGEPLARFAQQLRNQILQNNLDVILAYLNPTDSNWFDELDVLDELARAPRIAVYATKGVRIDPALLRRLEDTFTRWVYLPGRALSFATSQPASSK